MSIASVLPKIAAEKPCRIGNGSAKEVGQAVWSHSEFNNALTPGANISYIWRLQANSQAVGYSDLNVDDGHGKADVTDAHRIDFDTRDAWTYIGPCFDPPHVTTRFAAQRVAELNLRRLVQGGV